MCINKFVCMCGEIIQSGLSIIAINKAISDLVSIIILITTSLGL